MSNIVVPRFRLPAGATAEFRGLIHGWADTPLVAGDLNTAGWVLYQLNVARKTLTELEGYSESGITPASILSSPLLQGSKIQYNFHHVPGNRVSVPFATIGSIYRIVYTLTPANAAEQLIVVPFEVEVI